MAGFHDGSLRLYDVRLNPKEWLVGSFKKHSKRIIETRFLNNTTFISGSTDGSIHVWDTRFDSPSGTFDSGMEGDMSGFDIHSHHSLLVCGNTSQNIKIYNTQGSALSSIKYTEGFLSQRVGNVGVLKFHPSRLLLAACTTTSPLISLYTCNPKS